MFPGLSESLTSRSTPYDSQILRFRSTPSPDAIRQRILACVHASLRVKSLWYGFKAPHHVMTSFAVPVRRGYRVKSSVYREETRAELAQVLAVVSPGQQQLQQLQLQQLQQQQPQQQQQQQQPQQLLCRPRTSANERRLRRSASLHATRSCSIKVIGRQVSTGSLSRPGTPTLSLPSDRQEPLLGVKQECPVRAPSTEQVLRTPRLDIAAAADRHKGKPHLKQLDKQVRCDGDNRQYNFVAGEIQSQTKNTLDNKSLKAENDLSNERDATKPDKHQESSSGKKRRKSKLTRSSSFPSAPLSVTSSSVPLSHRPSSTVQLISRCRPKTADVSQVRTQSFSLVLPQSESSNGIALDDSCVRGRDLSPPLHFVGKGTFSQEATVVKCVASSNVPNTPGVVLITHEEDTPRAPTPPDIDSISTSKTDQTSYSLVEKKPEINAVNKDPPKAPVKQSHAAETLQSYPSSRSDLLEVADKEPVSIDTCEATIDQYPEYEKNVGAENSSKGCVSSTFTCVKNTSGGQYLSSSSPVSSQEQFENHQRSDNLKRETCSGKGDGELPDNCLSVAPSSVLDSESPENTSDGTPRSAITVPTPGDTHTSEDMKDPPLQLAERYSGELVDRASTYKIRYRGSHSAEGSPAELAGRTRVRAPQCSIAEEIRRQNQLLEERNSEASRAAPVTDKFRSDLPTQEVERQSRGMVPNKGDVCGSPGFGLLQDQLRISVQKGDRKDFILPNRKMGFLSKPLIDQGRRPLRGLCSPDEASAQGVAGGSKTKIIARESADALCVEGDACGPEAATSAASSAAPSPSLVPASVSRVSVQDSSLVVTSGNRAFSENSSSIHKIVPTAAGKVRVSLAYLKDRQGGAMTTSFRHRLSAAPEATCISTGSLTPTNNEAPPNLRLPIKTGNERLPEFCVQNATSLPQQSPRDLASLCQADMRRLATPGSTPRYMYVGFEVDESGSELEESQKKISSLQTSSNSTPTAALSNAELLYGPEGSRSGLANGDDLGGSADFPGGYERERQRLRDLDVSSSINSNNGSNNNNNNGNISNNNNKRPSSRNRQQRASCSVVEKVSFDRERDEGRAMTNSLPVKAPNFRSNGLRSTLVRGEQLLAQRGNNGSNSGRDPEDLIAMGTLWNPSANNNNNNLSGGSSGPNTRSSSTTTTSNKSTSNNNNNHLGSNITASSTNGASQRKPVSVAMSTSMRLHHSSSTGNLPFNGSGNILARQANNNNNSSSNNNNNKEVEPKYPDPIMGATASFQQRLMELAALEAETIRWERTKKVKKKPRADRDS